MADEGGLHPLHSPPNPELDIVAVHGLNGHHLNTWSNRAMLRSGTTMWLKDLLPKKMPNARIMTFQYDASLMGSVQSVHDHATSLIMSLLNEREDNTDARRPIVFIGHSLGGLVIKQALKSAANWRPPPTTAQTQLNNDGQQPRDTAQIGLREIAECTRGIVFFGTPHRGTDDARWASQLADIAHTAAGRPSNPLLEMLRTNSGELADLLMDFRPLAPRYAIVSFYEQHAHPRLGNVLVDKASVIMGLAHEEIMMMSGTHSTMCKFTDNDKRFDSVYRAIRRASQGRYNFQ